MLSDTYEICLAVIFSLPFSLPHLSHILDFHFQVQENFSFLIHLIFCGIKSVAQSFPFGVFLIPPLCSHLHIFLSDLIIFLCTSSAHHLQVQYLLLKVLKDPQ